MLTVTAMFFQTCHNIKKSEFHVFASGCRRESRQKSTWTWTTWVSSSSTCPPLPPLPSIHLNAYNKNLVWLKTEGCSIILETTLLKLNGYSSLKNLSSHIQSTSPHTVPSPQLYSNFQNCTFWCFCHLFPGRRTKHLLQGLLQLSQQSLERKKKKKVFRFSRKIKLNLITTSKIYVDAQPKKKKLVKNFLKTFNPTKWKESQELPSTWIRSDNIF